MNPSAYRSLKEKGENVVFLQITSGDEGEADDTNLYLAKEEGSLRGIRFMSNTYGHL